MTKSPTNNDDNRRSKDRLSTALRENLRKRKAQSKERLLQETQLLEPTPEPK
jgi:hypothetical protein